MIRFADATDGSVSGTALSHRSRPSRAAWTGTGPSDPAALDPRIATEIALTLSGTPGAPLTTQTWFGPEESPLFGSVHVPALRVARGAVVICPPLAREHIPTYRGLRQLAHQLAEAGYLVLRFDYRGQGDSSGVQSEPGMVDAWLGSIRHAVDYVRSAVSAPVSLIGIRAGALLATQIMREVGPLDSVVMLDPVVSGRRYVREQTAQYSVIIGDDTPDGRVSFIGGSFAKDTVDRLSSLTIDGAALAAAAPRVLAVVRDAGSGGKATETMLTTSNAECLASAQLENFVTPTSFVFSVPTALLSRVVEWIAAGPASPNRPVDLALRRSAVVGMTDEGSAVIESIQYRGPHRLLAIATTAEGVSSRDGLVVLHQTAAEHRIGPARLWVEGGRELAANGVPTIRFDRRGTGDSGLVAPNESTAPTSAASRQDIDHLVLSNDTTPQRTVHAGICSGSWHSAYAARQHGAAAVVMMNMAKWSFRNSRVPIKAAHVNAIDSTLVTALFRGARVVRNAMYKVRDALPDGAWRTLGKFGLVGSPDVVLEPLNARGARTVTLLSPEDQSCFADSRGLSALRQLRAGGLRPEVAVFGRGDHSLYHRDLRETMFDHLSTVVSETFGRPLPLLHASTPVTAEKL